MSIAGEEGEPPAAPPAAAVSAGSLGLYGTVAMFDPKQDDWCEYIERLEHYFSANDIVSSEKRRAILLTAVGASTYRLIRTLASSSPPTPRSSRDEVEIPEVRIPVEVCLVSRPRDQRRRTTYSRAKGEGHSGCTRP